jgi:hypothetical protein
MNVFDEIYIRDAWGLGSFKHRRSYKPCEEVVILVIND